MADIAVLAIKVENSDVPKATASLDAMTVAGGKTEAATQRLTRRMALLEIEARNMDAAMEKAGRSSFRLEGGMGGLASALQAVAGALVVRQVIGIADAYTNLHSRLRLVTNGASDLANVEARLYASSQQTRTSLESNVALYASLARSTKSLGLSQADLERMTKTVAQAFGVSGASATETAGAIRQLSQAMASGVLRGDEFNSIAENAPRLQQAVAASLGVTNGQLRAMAADGKITSDVLAKALLKSAQQIDAEFRTMPVTVSGAMEQIKNALLVGVGAMDGATGSTAGLSSALSAVAAAIPGIAKTINGFFAGIQLGALDARIALENMQDSFSADKWTTIKGLFAGATGNTRGALQAGVDLVTKNPELAELVSLRAKLQKQMEDNLTVVTTLTGATTAHGKAIATVTQLTDAQRKAAERLAEQERKRLSDLKLANQQVEIANQIAASDKKRTQTATQLAAALEGVAAQTERIHNAQIAIDADAAAVAAQQKYVDDMRTLWREGAGRIAADFVRSMAKGFEEVYSLAVKLMKRMEDANKASGLGYSALKYGAAAIGGGLAGFSAGQAIGAAGGNAAQGALGGAASGAMAGAAFGPWGALVGGIAGAAAGLFGFGSAAKEAAKQMAEAQKSIRLSITGAEADLRGDTLGAGTARIRAEIEQMRKAVEDAFSGGGANSDQVRKRNVELARLNALEADRIRMLTESIALAKRQAEEDVRVQILRNNGDAEAADAMAKAIDQERRFIELRKAGISEAMLEELRASELTRDLANAAAEAKRKADEAAVEAAQKIEEAARAAADAAQKAAEQSRAVEDINVEIMRARGDGAGADTAQFLLDQQRRLDDARKNQSEEYVQRLLELQQLQRDSRAAQSLIDSTTGPSSAYGASASQAASAVSGTVSDRSALMLVDLNRTAVSQRTTMITVLRSIDRKLGNGGGVRSVEAVDEGLARQQASDSIFGGSVSR